ncbi:MAG: T9SS type A sorting domain-containing protein [Bacteroidetes bacterium]|nr:T9SS type A sorting domain-containing protein [Bacteroidota bacterium]
MKNKTTLRAFAFFFLLSSNLLAQNFWVPDPVFRAQLKLKLSANCFTPQDSLISNSLDLALLKKLDVSNLNISSLEGVQYLTSLKSLNCSNNNLFHLPQLSDSLIYLNCVANALLDFPPLPPSLDSLLGAGNDFQANLTQLPDSLHYFHCNGCELTALPPLPASLRYLSCSSNHLTTLPTLPATLQYLDCSMMYIPGSITFPVLPSSLNTLKCDNDSLTSLPPLPNTLKHLYCGVNLLTSLPLLPDSLKNLGCSANLITSLPNLPASLRELSCGTNQLSSLPALPNSLVVLGCEENKLSLLPSLPNGLWVIYCEFNQLSSLPALPSGLEYLFCNNNFLTSLPPLPANLGSIDCSHNLLTSLTLPPNLFYLNCDSNQISSMTAVPSSTHVLICSNNSLSVLPVSTGNFLLHDIYCANNNLTNLPELPANLQILNCSDNPLSCLPTLPQNLEELTDSNTFISCVLNIPPNTIFEPANPAVCDTTFPSCYYSYVKGYVFDDLNGNGLKSATEKGIPLEVIYASVNSVEADTTGFFRAYCNYASTTFQINVPKYYVATTTNPHTVSIPTTTFTLYFGIKAAVNVNDLVIDITPHNAFRPGFNACSSIHYQNVGTNSVSNAKVKFLRPSALTNLGAVPPPTSFNGDTLIWNIGALASARDGYISLWDSVSTTTTIGDTISLQVWIEPLSGDSTLADNYFISNSIATGSFDPNDKSVSNDSIFTNTTAYLDYTIRFQNTGTDTAFSVTVTDTLSSNLNLSTIEMLSSSHKNKFWVEHGTAKWYFANILLPDSNVNEAGSHGFVKFRIKPKANLGAGIQIPNTANIYFDYNTAVVTNTIVVDVTPLSVPPIADEKLQLFPNPVHQMVHLKGSNSKPLGKVTLVNSEGKIIESKTISNSTYEWQVEQLPAGIYIFKGENWKEKILKK